MLRFDSSVWWWHFALCKSTEQHFVSFETFPSTYMCQWVIGMLIYWPVIGQNSVNSDSDWPKLTHSPMSVTWLRSKYWNSDDAQSQECTMMYSQNILFRVSSSTMENENGIAHANLCLAIDGFIFILQPQH